VSLSEGRSLAEGAPSLAPLTLGSVFGGRYRVERALGEGGMGAVYAVRDLQLDELVALKLMTLPSPEAAERFVDEVRLARRVTHPNVARTHDLGEHQGRLFLTMELVSGEPLDELLGREQRLPSERVTALGVQIAQGLKAAHAAGVIHRDLKPANVIVTLEGRAVITDFGIARAAARQGGKQTVGLIGTPAYMSPEQVAGGELDARSDLYALGLILYEALTGRLPFDADDAVSMAMARLRDLPAHPAKMGAEGGPLAELVMWLLAREPGGRPESAELVAQALEALREGGEPNSLPTGKLSFFAPMMLSEQTVAVLPFRYRGAAEHDYLGEGLAEELIDTLSRTKGVKVLALGATARFGNERDPIEVGKTLGAQVVVDGTVQLASDRVRLSVRLLDAAEGMQIWSERFDVAFDDVFALQESLGRRLAEALRLELAGGSGRQEVPREAVELLMRSRRELRRALMTSNEDILAWLDRALQLAPGFAPLLATHAMVSVRAWWTAGAISPADMGERARSSVERAERQAPDLAETHLATAMYAIQLGRFGESAAALRRALDIAPTLAEAHHYLASLQAEAGRPREAAERYRLALQLDPQLNVARLGLVRILALEGKYDEADAVLAEVAASIGENGTALLGSHLRVAMERGDLAEVRRLLARMMAAPEKLTVTIGKVFGVAVGAIEPAEAVRLIAQFEEVLVNRRFIALLRQIEVEAFCLGGHHDHALDVLQRLADDMLIDITWLDRSTPLAPLREHPRFAEAAAKVRFRAAAIWSL
jgi:serine/threonine-protein kinase